ncbi:MAG TPA: sialate O-acetylesterase [Armatimonadota bacterium]|nr:sialate O-acetylesterase [Armatimonadota bacterium]
MKALDDDVRVVRPNRYEVLQRDAGRASVPVQMTGLAELSGRVPVFVLNACGRVVARREFEVRGGALSGAVEVPEGGWYTLAMSAGRRRRRLMPFGVGDVFVVAGQSNAAGHGDGFIADRSGMVSVCTDAAEWALADSPERLPAGMGVGSPWPVLGELLARCEGVPIGFINVAVGGTSTEQWLPTGDLYPPLKRALSGRRVRAVLWHQGESDAIGSFSTERTYQNMATMIEQSRADAGWHVPWYVALASHIPDLPQEQMQQVRAAQQGLFRMGLALPGPDTDTYVPESMRYDRVHLAQVGLVVHAILWFRALVFPGH